MATAVYMEEEGSLYAWFKNEGDAVRQGELLAEVERLDKNSSIEISAPDSGVLRKRLVEKGENGGAQTLIAIIAGVDEDISTFAGNGDAAASGTAPSVQAHPAQGMESSGFSASPTREEPLQQAPAEPPSHAAPTPPPAAMPPAPTQGTGEGRAQAASPVARPPEPGMPAAGGPREDSGVRDGAGQRSDLVDGRAAALGGGSLAHNLIVSNVVGTLVPALRGTACRVVSQGMPVKPGRGENVFFPDVAVFCGTAELEQGAVEMLLNPRVVVEVLSPESTDFDHGKKWETYRRLPSLHDYLLVWHDQARVEQYTRQGAGWMFSEVEGTQEEIALESLGVTLRLAGIYEGVLTADEQSA